MDNVSVVGLDLAKNVFQVHCADDSGRCIQLKALRRPQVLRFFCNVKALSSRYGSMR